MSDLENDPHFVAGRERGSAWAKETLAAENADPREVLAVERIEAALGADRGDTAHGFLRGVRDVIMSLHPYERPNVIIEVARSGGASTGASAPVVPRRSLWARIRNTSYGDDH